MRASAWAAASHGAPGRLGLLRRRDALRRSLGDHHSRRYQSHHQPLPLLDMGL